MPPLCTVIGRDRG